jgi:hypothetical protein
LRDFQFFAERLTVRKPIVANDVQHLVVIHYSNFDAIEPTAAAQDILQYACVSEGENQRLHVDVQRADRDLVTICLETAGGGRENLPKSALYVQTQSLCITPLEQTVTGSGIETSDEVYSLFCHLQDNWQGNAVIASVRVGPVEINPKDQSSPTSKWELRIVRDLNQQRMRNPVRSGLF